MVLTIIFTDALQVNGQIMAFGNLFIKYRLLIHLIRKNKPS